MDLDEYGVGLAGGPYNLNNGYSSPTGSGLGNAVTTTPLAGNYGAWGDVDTNGSALMKEGRFDADLVSGSTTLAFVRVLKSGLDQVNLDGPQSFSISSSAGNGVVQDAAGNNMARLIRRFTREVSASATPYVLLGFTGLGADGAHAAGGLDLKNAVM